MGDLNIGAMSKISGASIRALRLYHEKNLLVPASVDERTGYRRYTLSQIGKLNCIEELKAAGLTLSEIADVISSRDVSCLRDEAERKRQELTKEIAQLQGKLAVASDVVKSCEAFLDKPTCDCVVHQYMPARFALKLDGVSHNDIDDGDTDFLQWLDLFLSIRESPKRPSSVLASNFCNYLIEQPDISRDIDFKKGWPVAFVEDSGAYDPGQVLEVPGGQYLMVYHDRCHNADGSDVSDGYLGLLLDYIEAEEYQIVGPLISEVLFPYMSLFDDDPQGYGRYGVAVKRLPAGEGEKRDIQ